MKSAASLKKTKTELVKMQHIEPLIDKQHIHMFSSLSLWRLKQQGASR